MRRSLLVSIVALVSVPIGVPPVQAVAPRPQAVVADGAFTDTLVTAGVSTPVAVTALPDGRAVVLEKAGRARVVKNGTLVAAPALTLTVCSSSERGLLGFAPDPDFGANGYVYVYYTRPSSAAPGGCVNRVSRFRMAGDVIARTSELVLLDNIGSPAGNHNGGDVVVGNDGFLYVSVGDGGCDPRGNSGCAGGNDAAQDLSLLNGKILRVDRTSGAPAPGNPFTGAGTASCRVRGNTPSTPQTRCREIFAYGLRNPRRIAFDPNTGATRFHINDVGQNTREEVDLGARGANYGWPRREGVCAQGSNPPCAGPPAGLVQPITDYSHAASGQYITGGAFVPNGAWPRSYDGGYLFADGSPGRVWFRSSAGAVNYATPFATGVAGISDMDFVMEAAGWSLYYVLPGDNQVRRIAPTLSAAPTTGNLAYAPVTPTRVFDSRKLGANSGPLRAGTSRLVRVVATRGAHRVALVNVTVIKPASAASITLWHPRSIRPRVPSVVVDRRATVANTAMVPIDPNGQILLSTTSTVNVIVDVLGYFDVAAGGVARAGREVPVSPNRALSTHDPANATTNIYSRTGTSLDGVVNVPIGTRYGVVPGARAVALVVQAVGSPVATGGHVVAHPHGTAVPPTSNVNLNTTTDRRINLVVVPLGSDGSIDLRLRGVSHVMVDVIGSFTGTGAPLASTGTFLPATPQRVVDTRRSLGLPHFASGGSALLNPSTVPDDAVAVMQNLWMIAPTAAGVVVASANGASRPTGLNVRTSAPGQVRATLAFSGLGAGAERISVNVATDVVVDVMGWFAR